MSDDLNSREDLLAQRDQAEFAATILRAQLEGWEAACALQIQVLRDCATFLRYSAEETPRVSALITRIEEATETNAGQTLLAALDTARKTLGAAYHGLMSYACGNSAPALAEEMAAEIKRVLGKVSME